MPQDYIRKQTLVGGERFFTPELKEYESLILNARDRIGELETSLFHQVCQQVGAASERILAAPMPWPISMSSPAWLRWPCAIAMSDPELTTDNEIVINQGRHPVVERSLADGSFVPNDTYCPTMTPSLSSSPAPIWRASQPI